MISRKISILALVLICAASFLLVMPTINKDVEDPNLITYFNSDEGYLIALIWYYYSGEEIAIYQLDADYGLEMLYIADLARIAFSRFIDFTPAIFALILRWLHFIAWVAALVALWIVMGRHFGKGWQQILTVLLLAVRPAFGYLAVNFKPEPLILLLMIIGIDYILRFIDDPSKKYIFIALALSAIAFLIKFAGIFLLPGIIAAVYFTQRYRMDSSDGRATIFPEIKQSWIFEFLTGLTLMTLPFVFILFYVRKSTGLTFFKEFGLLQSLSGHKESIFLIIAGLILAFISLLIFYLGKSKDLRIKGVMKKVNEFNSVIFITTGIFFAFLLFFGFRWIATPEIFLHTYSSNIFDFAGVFNIRNAPADLFGTYLKIVSEKLTALDMLMVLILLLYLIIERYFRQESLADDRARYYKRQVLIVILFPVFILMFSMGRFTYHHLLPFFVIMCVLSISGLGKFITSFQGGRAVKVSITALFSALFAVNILMNAAGMLKLRIYHYHRIDDVAFDIAGWWRDNYPLETSIVADHPAMVYLPPEYKNVKRLKFYEDKVVQFRALIESFRPQLIYYNIEGAQDAIIPSIEAMLPGKRARLVKIFDSEGKRYKRFPYSHYVVYEIIYNNTKPGRIQ